MNRFPSIGGCFHRQRVARKDAPNERSTDLPLGSATVNHHLITHAIPGLNACHHDIDELATSPHGCQHQVIYTGAKWPCSVHLKPIPSFHNRLPSYIRSFPKITHALAENPRRLWLTNQFSTISALREICRLSCIRQKSFQDFCPWPVQAWLCDWPFWGIPNQGMLKGPLRLRNIGVDDS